jgi:hypothetical protein
MKAFTQAIALVGLFLGANVVAAGVVQVLGRILQDLVPGLESPWPWFVIGGAGAFAAFLFVRGGIIYLAGGALLQWRPGRRGG